MAGVVLACIDARAQGGQSQGGAFLGGCADPGPDSDVLTSAGPVVQVSVELAVLKDNGEVEVRWGEGRALAARVAG